MQPLESQTFVITGASSGIGLATATRLARRGARLALMSRQVEPLRARLDDWPGEHIVRAGDVRDRAAWRALAQACAEAWPSVDGLFLNAGVAPFLPLDAVDAEAFDACMHTNVLGSMWGIAALRSQMTPGAAVVLTGSGMHRRPLPESSVWAASTLAVCGLAQALAVELAADGIRINVLSHGPVDTPIYERYGMPDEAVATTKAALARSTLLGRLAEADEIAEMAEVLLTTPAGFMTGTEVICDGGWALSPQGSP